MTYTRSPEQIIALHAERRTKRGLVAAKMEEVKNQVNGDVVVPLPELDRDEKAAVANLVQQGLDNYGMRIASVLPNLTVPPVNPRSPRSIERADTRRKATLAWWEDNRLPLKLRRRARWLVGYGMQGVSLRPNFDRSIARWDLRNPLSTFPAESGDPDDITPTDSIYAVERTWGWLKRCYPDQARVLAPDDDCPDGSKFTVLEYDDDEQITTIVVGKKQYTDRQYAAFQVLESTPNRAGLCLTVVGGRITLDRIQGQFDGILGMYQMQAKLMALEVLAVQRGVFPDVYLVSRPNETAKFVNGPHPGSSGLVNEIEGGDIKEVSIQPGFATTQTLDRLERAQRVQGGIPSEFGGESGTNIRTGRRGDAVMSAVVDFPIQEAQETLAYCLQEENRRATKIVKAYWGDKPASFYVQWKGAQGNIDYTPNKDFESDYSTVAYAMAGADVQNTTIGVGQLLGTELMSKRTARKIHPWIDNPELEGDLVVGEGLQSALLQGLQTQAASGQIPPSDIARITHLVVQENMDLAEAVDKAHQEAQARQASNGAPGTPEEAAEPGSPEAQPGLAQPGMGAEAGQPIGPPPTSMANLAMFLRQQRATRPV